MPEAGGAEQVALFAFDGVTVARQGAVVLDDDPLDAVRAQLVLMYVILAGVVIAAVVTALGTLRQLTTPAENLLVLVRSPSR